MSFTEADLRELRQLVFPNPDEPDEELSNAVRQSGEPQHLHVPGEGASPDPGGISDEARVRDYLRRMFDPVYDATEPELPE